MNQVERADEHESLLELLPADFLDHCRELDDRDWTEAGFTGEEADAYRRAWCFDPQVARELRDAGITPELAAQRVGSSPMDTIGSWVEEGIYDIDAALVRCGFSLLTGAYVN